jgi:hypothetical protein
MRKALATAAAAAALLMNGFALTPASAASGNQPVSFTVLGGTLAITPGTPAVGVNSVINGGVTTVTVPLGVTTVLDTRIGSTGWAVSASTTDFTQTLPAVGTIAKTLAKFSVPIAPVATVGSPTFTYVSTPTAVDAGGNLSNLVVATASGVNTATFTPQLDVTVPNGSATGVYTGTVTQSVV